MSYDTPSRSKPGPDRGQVLRHDVLDDDLALGDRAEPDEARDLDVIGADAPVAAPQTLDAAHPQDVRADALDIRSQRDQETAEILDVRLAGRVRDDGLALGEHGGHDGVLGARYRGFVEEHVRAAAGDPR